MENLNQVDDMVCEYLLFRGFTKSFRAFEEDRERDRTKGFNVDKIVINLFDLIHTGDYAGFNDLWSFLNSRFFCLLDATYVESVSNFWDSLRKLYVVTSIKKGKKEEVANFFANYCSDVLSSSQESEKNDDWRRWCSLPFLRNPEQDSYFMQFFSTTWEESLRTSLMNFLRAIFQNLSPPSLLGISIFKTERQRTQTQIRSCESEIALHKEECERARKMASSVVDILARVNTCVQQSKSEALQTELTNLLRDVPIEQYQESLKETVETPAIVPTLHRRMSQEINEATMERQVKMTINKKEEVAIFSENVNRCKWSRDGKHFVAAGGEGMLSIYNYDPDMTTASLFTSYSCANEVVALDWSYMTSPEAPELILYGLQGGILGLFNTRSSDSLNELTVNATSFADVKFSPQMTGYCAATVGATTPLTFWDMATNKVVLEAAGLGTSTRVNCVEYLPNGAGAFCGCMDGRVRLFDARSGRIAAEEVISREAISGLRLVKSPLEENSMLLFAASTDGVVREYDFRNMATISFNESE